MKTRLFSLMSLVMAVGMSLLLAGAPLAEAERQVPVQVNPAPLADVQAVTTYKVYLPVLMKDCSTGQTYNQGPVYQYDNDNPVRPAYNHADKNFALRGYSADNGQTKALAAITGATDANAPQLNTLVSPERKFTITSTRSSYNWDWGTPPDPGTKGTLITSPAVTVVGLQVAVGETIRVPTSGYDLGGNPDIKAIVTYADSTRITLHYTRDDSTSPGYTIHIDNLCVDPSLLSLYNSLDGTARNTYYGSPCCGTDYNLVTLTYNQPIGTASSTELIVAIRDTGSFMDPRSCKDWWKTYWNGSTSSPVCL